MVVDVIREARVAALIGARQLRQIHAGGVREDEPLPGDLHTLLPVCRCVLVGADKAAALRDEDVLASGAVEYVLAYLGEDRSRQIRVDAADQNGGDDASRHHREGRGQRRGKKGRQRLSASYVCRERDQRIAHPAGDALRRMDSLP